jgi:thiol-disulfide isomerase/thioredoxin
MVKKKQSYQYWPQTIVALVAVTVIFIVALIGYQQPSEDSLPQVVEKKIPGTMFLTLNGKEVVLQDLIKTDKNLLIFWATWCGPCVEEIKNMPKLLPLIKEKGYAPIFVNYDHEDTLASAEAFAKNMALRQRSIQGAICFLNWEFLHSQCPLLWISQGKFCVRSGAGCKSLVCSVASSSRS